MLAEERLALVLFHLARDEVPVGAIESVVYRGLEGKRPLFAAAKTPTGDAAATPLLDWARTCAARILFQEPEPLAELAQGVGETSDGHRRLRNRIRLLIRRNR